MINDEIKPLEPTVIENIKPITDESKSISKDDEDAELVGSLPDWSIEPPIEVDRSSK